jgi:hypothetical protein
MIKDRVEAQMVVMDTKRVPLVEVFMPSVMTREDWTRWERVRDGRVM